MLFVRLLLDPLLLIGPIPAGSKAPCLRPEGGRGAGQTPVQVQLIIGEGRGGRRVRKTPAQTLVIMGARPRTSL